MNSAYAKVQRVWSVFAFLPPIALTGLVVIALILAERSFAGPVPLR